MLRDLGSRDTEFISTIQSIRDGLLKVANVDSKTWTTVPMQGSGTFAVEAVLQTATPRKNGKVNVITHCIGAESYLKSRLDVYDVFVIS